MYAFAIWDEPRSTLFLARDRMGQKPLYVAFAQPGEEVSTGKPPKPGAESIAAIAFGSELPALLALPWVSRAVANDALVEYLQWGYIPSPLTIYEGAWRLKPATTMTVTRGGAVERPYFDPNRRAAFSGDPVQRTRQLVTQAVQRQ